MRDVPTWYNAFTLSPESIYESWWYCSLLCLCAWHSPGFHFASVLSQSRAADEYTGNHFFLSKCVQGSQPRGVRGGRGEVHASRAFTTEDSNCKAKPRVVVFVCQPTRWITSKHSWHADIKKGRTVKVSVVQKMPQNYCSSSFVARSCFVVFPKPYLVWILF